MSEAAIRAVARCAWGKRKYTLYSAEGKRVIIRSGTYKSLQEQATKEGKLTEFLGSYVVRENATLDEKNHEDALWKKAVEKINDLGERKFRIWCKLGEAQRVGDRALMTSLEETLVDLAKEIGRIEGYEYLP